MKVPPLPPALNTGFAMEPDDSWRVAPLIRLSGTKNRKEYVMLGWALTFLIVALVAAALGFTGIAGAASSIAQILFVIFLVLFLIAMLARALQGRPPV